MWSETVGLRTRPVWDQKNLGLGRHTDLEGHSNFPTNIYSFLICARNLTTVEINSGVHLLKS